MKALVVYDSVFGNTEKIAQAIGAALGSLEEVGILRVGDMAPEQLANVEVLIVGSPTRAFSPTPATKAMLKAIPAKALSGIKVAAFDTRISVEDTSSKILSAMVKVFGYAAKPIADRLKSKGGDLVLAPEGFYVQDSEGPLKEGELERAAAWAKQVNAV
ncbi:MAG: flavodoxin family protein [Anaerolineae bacterium]|nr:flavodoxin family protein [Anaerolineae bacterium]